MEKKTRFFNIKSIDNAAKTATAYVSTRQWDRMREKFAKGAWDLTNFRNNPVVLWAHNSQTLPIAKALQVEEDDFGLLAKMEFDQEQVFAMQVFSMFSRGFLNTFSVGFWPKEYQMEPMDDDPEKKGVVWTKAELLEFSAVPIPANPGAVIVREDADLIVKTLGDKFIRNVNDTLTVLDVSQVEDLEKRDLETCLKNLMELARITKNEKIDAQKLTLVKQSISVLQEIMNANVDGVSRRELNELMEIVEKLVEIISTNKPDYQDMVSKVLTQIDAAVRSGRAE